MLSLTGMAVQDQSTGRRKIGQLVKAMCPGVKNVLHPKLVNEKDIIMPPLHIKLGLMKNFVKKLDRTDHTFLYFGTKSPKLSEATIKEGVFIGPQIRELLKDKRFDEIIVGKEKAA